MALALGIYDFQLEPLFQLATECANGCPSSAKLMVNGFTQEARMRQPFYIQYVKVLLLKVVLSLFIYHPVFFWHHSCCRWRATLTRIKIEFHTSCWSWLTCQSQWKKFGLLFNETVQVAQNHHTHLLRDTREVVLMENQIVGPTVVTQQLTVDSTRTQLETP